MRELALGQLPQLPALARSRFRVRLGTRLLVGSRWTIFTVVTWPFWAKVCSISHCQRLASGGGHAGVGHLTGLTNQLGGEADYVVVAGDSAGDWVLGLPGATLSSHSGDFLPYAMVF